MPIEFSTDFQDNLFNEISQLPADQTPIYTDGKKFSKDLNAFGNATIWQIHANNDEFGQQGFIVFIRLSKDESGQYKKSEFEEHGRKCHVSFERKDNESDNNSYKKAFSIILPELLNSAIVFKIVSPVKWKGNFNPGNEVTIYNFNTFSMDSLDNMAAKLTENKYDAGPSLVKEGELKHNKYAYFFFRNDKNLLGNYLSLKGINHFLNFNPEIYFPQSFKSNPSNESIPAQFQQNKSDLGEPSPSTTEPPSDQISEHQKHAFTNIGDIKKVEQSYRYHVTHNNLLIHMYAIVGNFYLVAKPSGIPRPTMDDTNDLLNDKTPHEVTNEQAANLRRLFIDENAAIKAPLQDAAKIISHITLSLIQLFPEKLTDIESISSKLNKNEEKFTRLFDLMKTMWVQGELTNENKEAFIKTMLRLYLRKENSSSYMLGLTENDIETLTQHYQMTVQISQEKKTPPAELEASSKETPAENRTLTSVVSVFEGIKNLNIDKNYRNSDLLIARETCCLHLENLFYQATADTQSGNSLLEKTKEEVTKFYLAIEDKKQQYSSKAEEYDTYILSLQESCKNIPELQETIKQAIAQKASEQKIDIAKEFPRLDAYNKERKKNLVQKAIDLINKDKITPNKTVKEYAEVYNALTTSGINQHKHAKWDALIGLKNTRSLQKVLKLVRDKAYEALLKEINDMDPGDKITRLTEARKMSLFKERRHNYFFTGAFWKTGTVTKIDKEINKHKKILKEQTKPAPKRKKASRS